MQGPLSCRLLIVPVKLGKQAVELIRERGVAGGVGGFVIDDGLPCCASELFFFRAPQSLA